MNKPQKYPSAYINELEEKQIIELFLELSPDPDLELNEYPIRSVKQSKLQVKDCIPDAIIQNKRTGKKVWVEVTCISRSEEDRKKIGLRRKGLSNDQNELLTPYRLDLGTKALIESISSIISQKCNKSYKESARLAKLDHKGILVVQIVLPDPYLDINELDDIISRLKDYKVLFSLGVEGSSFRKIYLLVYVQLKNKDWMHDLILIADEKVMDHLKKLNNEMHRKKKLLEELKKSMGTI